MDRKFYLKTIIFLFLSANIVLALPEKNELDQNLQKLDETKGKINSLTPSDFTTYLTEINQIKIKIDELTDNIFRVCNQMADKGQAGTCISDAKAKLKTLWSAYFKSKEEYLNKLHAFFLQENSNQAQNTELTLDSISIIKK